MKKLVLALLILGLTFAFVGCGETAPSPHEQINELLDQVEHYLALARDDFQESERLAAELRDNFDERLEANRLTFIILGTNARNNAYELAAEATQIANEHGIDIHEMLRRRVVPEIMELFE